MVVTAWHCGLDVQLCRLRAGQGASRPAAAARRTSRTRPPAAGQGALLAPNARVARPSSPPAGLGAQHEQPDARHAEPDGGGRAAAGADEQPAGVKPVGRGFCGRRGAGGCWARPSCDGSHVGRRPSLGRRGCPSARRGDRRLLHKLAAAFPCKRTCPPPPPVCPNFACRCGWWMCRGRQTAILCRSCTIQTPLQM